MQFSFVSKGPEETYEFGKNLGRLLSPGDIVCLEGELGTGKTILTKGIAAGLGIKGNVTSPTYTLINEYSGDSVSLYHFDLYRLEDGEELFYIGGEDILYGQGVSVIEWASRAKDLLPEDCIWIYFGLSENNAYLRHIKIMVTEHHKEILKHFNGETSGFLGYTEGSVNTSKGYGKEDKGCEDTGY